MRRLLTLTLFAALPLLLNACGASSGQSYTSVQLAPNCDSEYISLGQPINDVVRITNTSGHNFGGTYASIDAPDFRIDNVSMDDAQSDEFAGTYNLGPLAPGDIGDLHILMTATGAETAPRVTVQVFGGSKGISDMSTSTINFPASAFEVHCDHVIGS